MFAVIGALLVAVGGYRLLSKTAAPPVSEHPAGPVEQPGAPAEAAPSPPPAPAASPAAPPPTPAPPPARAESPPGESPAPVGPSEPAPPTRPSAGPFGMRSARPSLALQQATGRMGDAMLMARVRELAKTDPAQALELARAGNARYPQSPFAGERASIAVKALLSQGETAKARAEAERAVNRYPDGPWVREVEELTGVRRNPTPAPGADPQPPR